MVLIVPTPDPIESELLLTELQRTGVTGFYVTDQGLLLHSDEEIDEQGARDVVATHSARALPVQQKRATESTNEATLQQQAVAALASNRTFLALQSPTNAQTLAQVKALTRQSTGVIRLLLRRLDGTD